MSQPPALTTILDDTFITQLGPELYGYYMWICLNSHPAGDVPGGWCISLSVDELREAWGIGEGKTRGILRDLVRMRLLVRSPGRHLGRGIGTTPHRYFLSYSDRLTHPKNPDGDGNRGVVPLTNRHAITPFDNARLQNRGLISVTNAPHSVEGYTPDLLSPQKLRGDHDDELIQSSLKNHEQAAKTGLSKPVNLIPLPASIKTTLTRLGWVGDLPAHVDPIVAGVLATWLLGQGHRYNNPGAYLRTVLNGADGGLELAAELGLITGPLTGPGDNVGSASVVDVMPHPDWVRREIDDPDWADAVRTEAARRASEAGMRVSMLMVRTVAAEWDSPASQKVELQF